MAIKIASLRQKMASTRSCRLCWVWWNICGASCERVSDKKLFALKFFKNASINDIQSAEKVRKKQALGFHPYLVNTVDFDTDITYPFILMMEVERKR